MRVKPGMWVSWANIMNEADGEYMLQCLWSTICLINDEEWTRNNYHLHICGFIPFTYRKDVLIMLKRLNQEASWSVSFFQEECESHTYVNKTLYQNPMAQYAQYIAINPLIVGFPDKYCIKELHNALLQTNQFTTCATIPMVGGLTKECAECPGPLYFCPMLLCRTKLVAPWPQSSKIMLDGQTAALRFFILQKQEFKVCEDANIHVISCYQETLGEKPYVQRKNRENRILTWMSTFL